MVLNARIEFHPGWEGQGCGEGPETWRRAHASQHPSQKQFPAGSLLVLCQPTVLRRVKGPREEFLQLADPQRGRREEGSQGNGLSRLGGRRRGREGRGPLEAHQQLGKGRASHTEPHLRTATRLRGPLVQCRL